MALAFPQRWVCNGRRGRERGLAACNILSTRQVSCSTRSIRGQSLMLKVPRCLPRAVEHPVD
eukprot:341423-Lingulodinium_polyedra.AAC.1